MPEVLQGFIQLRIGMPPLLDSWISGVEGNKTQPKNEGIHHSRI
jgi:hypothetical protein